MARDFHPYKMDEYPSAKEKPALEAAEKLMLETMACYDPSHDAFHG